MSENKSDKRDLLKKLGKKLEIRRDELNRVAEESYKKTGRIDPGSFSEQINSFEEAAKAFMEASDLSNADEGDGQSEAEGECNTTAENNE